MRDPIVLQIAEYMPDQPDGAGSENILNVYPRTALSYGPIQSGSPTNNAINADPRGVHAFKFGDANWYLFAADAGNIYRTPIPAASLVWTNVSRSANSYSTGDYRCEYADFNGNIVATNGVDAIQSIILDGGTTFSNLSADAPIARYLAVVKNAFLVLGVTTPAGGGVTRRQRVHWSAAGDHTNWPAIGSSAAAAVQSGAADLLGDGGAIQGFAPNLANAEAVVFQEFAVKRMEYVGPPSVFSFLPVENARGCRSPYSIVVVGGWVYYWGQDGIYAFDGIESRPIGANKVNRAVFLDCDDFTTVQGVADPERNLVAWCYKSSAALLNTTDTVLLYNYVLDRFSLAEVTMSRFGFSSVVTLDGDPTIAYFDDSHKLNYFTGSKLAATIETQELQPQPGKLWYVNNTKPVCDAAAATSVTVQMGRRNTKYASVSYPEAAVSRNTLGYCPQRISGQYMRGKIAIAAGGTWDHFSGLEILAVPQGAR